jgi:glycolate oxidase FAD binding subunit
VAGVVPRWVVRPADVSQVQAVVREERPLVASGLGAHLAIGARPRSLEVLLRLDRLDHVIAHEAGDMTVTVQGGCPFGRLARVLAAAGQWLPLDPPSPEATTAGGLIAANLAGPLRASQGTVRDLLLGIRVVGEGGALVTGGGRVVKNVAGYDLPKLHVGALGSAGVIVEATFKLRPRPACEEAVVLHAPSVTAAADAALAVRDGMDPLWLEVAGEGVCGDQAALAVGLGGVAEEVADAKHAVSEIGARLGLPSVPVADGAALRARLADFAVGPAAAVLRASTLPADVGATMEAMLAAARAARARVRCLARAASGVVHLQVVEPAAVAPLVSALRPGLEARGGHLVVERAVPTDGLDVWGDVGPGRDLMRRLKVAFDRADIFAPGRFVS